MRRGKEFQGQWFGQRHSPRKILEQFVRKTFIRAEVASFKWRDFHGSLLFRHKSTQRRPFQTPAAKTRTRPHSSFPEQKKPERVPPDCSVYSKGGSTLYTLKGSLHPRTLKTSSLEKAWQEFRSEHSTLNPATASASKGKNSDVLALFQPCRVQLLTPETSVLPPRDRNRPCDQAWRPRPAGHPPPEKGIARRPPAPTRSLTFPSDSYIIVPCSQDKRVERRAGGRKEERLRAVQLSLTPSCLRSAPGSLPRGRSRLLGNGCRQNRQSPPPTRKPADQSKASWKAPLLRSFRADTAGLSSARGSTSRGLGAGTGSEQQGSRIGGLEKPEPSGGSAHPASNSAKSSVFRLRATWLACLSLLKPRVV